MTSTSLRSLLPKAWLLGLTAVVTATLVACGGGGSSTGASATPSGTQTYSGTVTGLGSIVVNGVRFSTSGATTADEDDPTAPYAQAFKLGATVVVKGSVNGSDGQAASIEVVGGTRGQISGVNLTSSTMIVAGQLIKFDANTVFDGEGDPNFNATWLAANFGTTPVYVEVYGAADATGTITATRIEKKSATGIVFAIKGFVTPNSITATAFDMQIKDGVTLTTKTVHVDYQSATVLPRNATLHDGIGVRVLTTTDPVNATSITARKVLIKSDRGVNGEAAKIHGVVTISGSTWTIGDVTIDVSQNPILRGFSSLSAITSGTELRVAGLFKDNVLTAKIIESDDFEHDRDGGGVKLFGVATVTSTNTFTVQGVTVTVPTTLSLPGLTLPNLPVMPTTGAYVEVVAAQIQGVLTAVRISTPTSANPFEVFGTAACTNGASDLQSSFSLSLQPVGTVTVNASGATLETDTGVDMTASSTAKTCLVEVKGTASAGSITATQIEVKARN